MRILSSSLRRPLVLAPKPWSPSSTNSNPNSDLDRRSGSSSPRGTLCAYIATFGIMIAWRVNRAGMRSMTWLEPTISFGYKWSWIRGRETHRKCVVIHGLTQTFAMTCFRLFRKSSDHLPAISSLLRRLPPNLNLVSLLLRTTTQDATSLLRAITLDTTSHTHTHTHAHRHRASERERHRER